MKNKLFLVVLFILFFTNFSFAQSPFKVLLIPFENFSLEPDAFEKVKEPLIKELRLKGLVFYDEEFTKKVMDALEIRERGYVLKKKWDFLLKKYGVRYVMTGSILRYTALSNTKVALHVRLIDLERESIIWSGFAGRTGLDYETFFGFGRITDINKLTERIIKELVKDFELGVFQNSALPEKRPVFALLTFKNLSPEPYKGKVFTYLLLSELSKQKNIVVKELGEVAEVMISSGILPRGEVTYEELKRLSGATGANYVLIGAVEDFFEEGVKTDYPQLLISLRILESKSKRIILAMDRFLTGIDKEGILERGRLRSVEQVAMEVVKEITEILKKGGF